MFLLVDTATRAGFVALADRSGVLARCDLGGDRNHGASLATSVATLVGDDFSRIEAYALSIGPGSFTGLRVGLSFLKGLAFVHPRPTIPVSTLETVALGILRSHPDAEHALALLDARRNEVYAALYSRTPEPLDPVDALVEGAYRACDIPDRVRRFSRIVAGGDGLALDFGGAPAWRRADSAHWVPDPDALAILACRRFDAGMSVDVASLEPVYHQVSAAEANLARARGLPTDPKRE